MPDVIGVAALDVLIGMGVFFLVLSIVCSAINEIISSALRLRARYLEAGLRRMLSRPEDALLEQLATHPLISGKVPGKRSRFPSYLNSKTFALSFLDTIAPPKGGGEHDVLARARQYADSLTVGDPLRRVLHAFLDQSGEDVERFRRSVENWFDLTMNRVSGWYRRRVQTMLLIIATVLVVLANADSFQVAERLWRDDSLRAAVAAEASRSDPADCSDAAIPPAERAAQCYEGIEELGIPLGWSNDTIPRNEIGILGKLLGLLVTVAGLSLGAPFWFDFLGKVSNLRATGRREVPTQDAT
jgi:hypothetical protein